jgi:thiamine-monophosphate kinase
MISDIKKICTPNSDQVIYGIGDDCAVVSYSKDSYQIITTDSMVEDIHFSTQYFTAFNLGYKSLAINLSDIASMGGDPKYAVVSLGLNHNDQDWINDFYQGLQSLAHQFSVDIIGGNLSQSDKNWISITLIGDVKKENLKTRNNIKESDTLWVTGPLGLAKLGFLELNHQNIHPKKFKNYHLKPFPKIKEGKFLSKLSYVHGMMDISDGLGIDLSKMLAESKFGADIFIPDDFVNEEKFHLSSKFNENFFEIILTGGEDYELLFSVDHQHEEDFKEEMKKSGFHFYKIGHLTSSLKQINFFDDKKNQVNLTQLGYSHFS